MKGPEGELRLGVRTGTARTWAPSWRGPSTVRSGLEVCLPSGARGCHQTLPTLGELGSAGFRSVDRLRLQMFYVEQMLAEVRHTRQHGDLAHHTLSTLTAG